MTDYGASIGVKTLYQMGYRVCHAKNIAIAVNVLKDVSQGRPILNERMAAAIRALEYAPLSSAQFILLGDRNAEEPKDNPEKSA